MISRGYGNERLAQFYLAGRQCQESVSRAAQVADLLLSFCRRKKQLRLYKIVGSGREPAVHLSDAATQKLPNRVRVTFGAEREQKIHRSATSDVQARTGFGVREADDERDSVAIALNDEIMSVPKTFRTRKAGRNTN